MQCKKGGKPLRTLSILDKLVIMLQYYREYRTMQHIAFDYGVSKTVIWKSIRWAEDILIKSMASRYPPKAVLIDATECEIEHPIKIQKIYYSGKKKKHTLKYRLWRMRRLLMSCVFLLIKAAGMISNCLRGAAFIFRVICWHLVIRGIRDLKNCITIA